MSKNYSEGEQTSRIFPFYGLKVRFPLFSLCIWGIFIRGYGASFGKSLLNSFIVMNSGVGLQKGDGGWTA